MEHWKDISDFEEYYEVSNLGRVRSKTRYIRNGMGTRICRGRVLKPRNNSAGYLFVSLHDATTGRVLPRYIHSLVAEAFLGKSLGMTVDHLNRDTTDNRLSNLEVVSQSENTKRWRGDIEGFDTTRLTRDEVRFIRYSRAIYGSTYRELGQAFDVNWRTIQKVCKRETWKNVL